MLLLCIEAISLEIKRIWHLMEIDEKILVTADIGQTKPNYFKGRIRNKNMINTSLRAMR